MIKINKYIYIFKPATEVLQLLWRRERAPSCPMPSELASGRSFSANPSTGGRDL